MWSFSNHMMTLSFDILTKVAWDQKFSGCSCTVLGSPHMRPSPYKCFSKIKNQLSFPVNTILMSLFKNNNTGLYHLIVPCSYSPSVFTSNRHLCCIFPVLLLKLQYFTHTQRIFPTYKQLAICASRKLKWPFPFDSFCTLWFPSTTSHSAWEEERETEQDPFYHPVPSSTGSSITALQKRDWHTVKGSFYEPALITLYLICPWYRNFIIQIKKTVCMTYSK